MAQRICSVPDCNRPHRARGFCDRHYGKARYHGVIGIRWTSLAERFWARVDKSSGPDGCWLWDRPNPFGYGRFNVNGRGPNPTRAAHRVAYELVVGPVPPGLDLGHRCHDRDLSCPGGVSCPHRACVNPAHLTPQTHAENMRSSHVTRKKSECPAGHPYTPENMYGNGACKTCRRERALRKSTLRFDLR